MKISITN